MTLPVRLDLRYLPGLALLACVLVGCSSNTNSGGAPFSDQEFHMKRIASLYNDFKNSHKGAYPKNTAELKAWVKSMKKEEQQKHNIDDPDKVFISPRDKEEYVVVPTPKNAMMGMSKIIAYEKNGVGGKRWKIGTQGYINEVSDEDLDKLLAEIGQKR